MSEQFKCRSCGTDLEDWNVGTAIIRHCPSCGTKLPTGQADQLWRKCTDSEIEDMIKERILEALDNCEDITAEELSFRAWESENCDGVVFYSNYKADRFVMRHSDWVDSALEHLEREFGDEGHYLKMKADCNDRFLVAAFIEATEHFLFGDCEIESDGRELSKERIVEIKECVKSTRYSGDF